MTPPVRPRRRPRPHALPHPAAGPPPLVADRTYDDARAPLSTLLADALDQGPRALDPLLGAEPVDLRDRFLTLLTVYDLHTAPLDVVGDRARHQGHPVVAEIKDRLETAWLDELERDWQAAGQLSEATSVERVVSAMRAVAAKDRLPHAYRWLAKEASWTELVDFLALEGGPDGGFDDLVARLPGRPVRQRQARARQELLGRDGPGRPRRRPHRPAPAACPRPSRCRTCRARRMPVEALERAALGGLLSTNRWLQPEMLGALGLLELQAGPALPAGAAGLRPPGRARRRLPLLRRARRGGPGPRPRLDGQGRRPDRGRAAGLGPAHRQGRVVALDGQPALLRGRPPRPRGGATARRPQQDDEVAA